MLYKKESVELDSFIKMEVVVKPESNKRTMPHTWIVWGVCTRRCIATHSYTRNECCPLSLILEKLPHFHFRTSKTLSICLLLYPNSTTNLENISQMNNTPRDIARIIYRIYVWTPGKRKRRAGALLWIDRFSPYRATKIRCSVPWPHKNSLLVLTLDTKNISQPYSFDWCPRFIINTSSTRKTTNI